MNTAKAIESKPVIPLKELEDILHLSYKTLLQYAKDGTIEAVQVGRQWRVSIESLRKFDSGESVEAAKKRLKELQIKAADNVAAAIFEEK